MPILTQLENAQWMRLRKEAQMAARAHDFPGAENIYNLALESARQQFGENSSHFAVVLCDLAECYEAQGKEAQAEECFGKVSIILKTVGK